MSKRWRSTPKIEKVHRLLIDLYVAPWVDERKIGKTEKKVIFARICNAKTASRGTKLRSPGTCEVRDLTATMTNEEIVQFTKTFARFNTLGARLERVGGSPIVLIMQADVNGAGWAVVTDIDVVETE